MGHVKPLLAHTLFPPVPEASCCLPNCNMDPGPTASSELKVPDVAGGASASLVEMNMSFGSLQSEATWCGKVRIWTLTPPKKQKHKQQLTKTTPPPHKKKEKQTTHKRNDTKPFCAGGLPFKKRQRVRGLHETKPRPTRRGAG